MVCPCERWIRSYIRFVPSVEATQSLVLLRECVSASFCAANSQEVSMLPYRIADIRPKSGILADVHHSKLNRACQILSMDIGKRG